MPASLLSAGDQGKLGDRTAGHGLAARHRETIAGYLFIAPSFLLYTAFVLVPMLGTLYLSFTFYDRSGTPEWVGLENYAAAVTSGRFWTIFRNTLVFTLFAVVGNVGLGLALAVLLNRSMPKLLLYLFRLAYFLPVIIAMSFVSIVWSFLYSTDLGVLNYYLQVLGLPRIGWLTDRNWSMASILIMDVWKNTGFSMLVFLAALQSVPTSLLEAARLDGANGWQIFWRIVFPMLSPVVFFNVIIVTVGALQVFESVVILTNGGPGDQTRSIVMLIYHEAFSNFDLGYAAAISVILLGLIGLVTALQFWASRRWVHY
jgi:multiple sugar transport system permease protein